MKKHFTLLFSIVVFVAVNTLFGSNSTGKERAVTANFTTDITLLTSGSTINFMDMSTGSPVSWQWTFIGGQPATYSGRIPPPIKYNSSGQFDVVLTVQDAAGNASIEAKSDYIHVVDSPAGWEVQTSGSTHLISVPATLALTGFPFVYGDFLGVFYLDENNQEKCGGSVIWDGTSNRALVAFGDDATTAIKEGFAEGELLRWKVYLSQYSDQANATVIYNLAMPVSDGKFHDNGMSGITALNNSYTIPLAVQASAAPTQPCAGDPVQLNAAATGGTLTYSYSWNSSPAGFSSNLQNPVAFPETNATYTVVVNDGDNTATASAAVVVTNKPSANAGGDATIIAWRQFEITGSSASGSSALQWSTIGDGTFSNSTLLHPTYSPGLADIIAGQVQLCLTAQPVAPCAAPDSDCMDLFIEPSAVASAGPDRTICAERSVLLSSSNAENYKSIIWSTTGSGTFNKENLLHPEYFPSAADVISGSVDLCLTAYALPPEVSSVTDCMTLSFQQLPVADAGYDLLVCEGSSITLSASTATNAGVILWISSGDGTFSNENILNPIYYPALSDYQKKCITLTLMVSGITPCSNGSQDDLEVCFKSPPQANAGNDQTICETDLVNLQGSVQNECGNTWSTSGDGTFDDAGKLQTVYSPGSADIAQGSIVLYLTAQPCDPCATAHTDSLTLTLQPLASVDVGSDALICSGENFNTDAALAANYQQVQWLTTDGNGYFANESQLHTTYYPAPTDYISGCVTLKLVASSIDPCQGFAEDFMELCFQPTPTVVAGGDATVCEGGSFASIMAEAENFEQLQWSGGIGFFDDPTKLDAIYTPATAEAGTQVELCLTASPVNPCSLVATDCLSLFVQPAPIVFAGPDVTFCEGVIVQLDAATASNYSQIMWMAISGLGDFSNFLSLATCYAPSPFDYQAGCITLGLMAQPVNPCTLAIIDTLEVCFQPPASADAGQDQTLCGSDVFHLTTSNASNYSTVTWTTVGDGTFDNPQLLHPKYFPGNSDIAYLSVDLMLSAQGISPCTNTASDALTLTLQPSPDAFAGADAIIAAGEVYTTADASVAFAESFFWQTSGDGTFDDLNALHTQYVHGSADQTAGKAMLFLTAQPISPCLVAETDSMLLSVVSPPTVSVPEDVAICSDSQINLVGADATNFASLLWQTSGDGTFDDPALLNPIYYPGLDDAEVGSVELCLTAQPILPLFSPATDCIDITIQKAPTAFAGNDQIICESENVELNEASANNFSAVLWSGGAGSFDNPNILNPTYTPAASESGNTVTLCLLAMAVDPCTVAATDCIDITIQKAPTAFAGNDQIICESENVELNEASANNFSAVHWSGGAGSFYNANILHPTYTPAASEAGTTVTLCLSAMAVDPCTVAANDCLKITLQKAPTAFAGNDQIICESGSIILSEATATNSLAVLWSGGAGSFDNANILNPTYTPAASEAGTNVTLCLSAMAVDPCTVAANDCLKITLQKAPTAFAGNDQIICESETIELNEASANIFSAVLWSGGAGSFDNPNLLHPTYTPTASEAGTTVTLCLSAMAVDPCTVAATDCIKITIQKAPTAFAGNDQIICESETIELNEASANNFSAVLWSGGAGSFDNANLLHPTYMPSASEAGTTVTLCLSAMAFDPCTVAANDCINITIQKAPIAFAGNDQIICESENVELNEASANNFSAVLWSGGVGSFDNANILHPTYTPADSEAGTTVTLCLSAMAFDPCTVAANDCLKITIQKAPTAFAGNDQIICESENVELSEASANNFSTVLWSGGVGSFDNANILHPTYTPADSEAGTTVTLCLSAMAVDPCTVAATDCINITIQKAPTAFAGNDQIICESDFIQLTATATNYVSLLWSTTGNGTFANANAPSTIYTPGAGDALQGEIKLILEVQPLAPCSAPATDAFILTVQSCQSVTIPAGWSGLSSWVQPADPNVEEVFENAAQSLVILQNLTGVWWPVQNLNTITDWNVEDGYMVKMTEPATIQFAGIAAQQTLQLKVGWNLIPVLSRCDVDVAVLFADVDVEIVKEVAGWNLYWPFQNINTLEMLLPGKAYLVKMPVPAAISFPVCE